MKAKVYVAGIESQTWFQGSRDERDVPMLNCLDSDAHLGMKLKQTFDYMLSRDEATELKLDPIEGAIIVLSITEFKPGAGGRLRASGQIDRSTLPKGALEAKNGAGSPVPSGTTTKT